MQIQGTDEVISSQFIVVGAVDVFMIKFVTNIQLFQQQSLTV